MSSDTVPQVRRALFPTGVPRTESASGQSAATPARAAVHPSPRPVSTVEPSLVTAHVTAPAEPALSRPVSSPPRLEAPEAETPRVASRLSAARVPAQVSAPMNQVQARPLSEIIQRRDAQGFKELFKELVTHDVSDVHMTRSVLDQTFTVEARVDGKKQLVHVYKGVEATTIATLIKTDSKMSSNVNLVPEDGSYDLPMNGYPYRARVVALPLFDGGERIVFRLPQTGDIRAIDNLGFSESNLTATKDLLGIPGGMTLFAGPTGEGKSTTSLSAIMYLKSLEDGVFITLEDPVERIIPGISQIEVNEKVEGAGFGDQLKYLKRSDPNVLFIGEIRDTATATAAVSIAKSGRRVIATIHANDNVSAFMNLIEMADATPMSVLESVNGIVSQRLVPRLVPGTNRFAGRYPIHEVTSNSEALTDALIANVSRAAIREAAAATSTTFKDNVHELVAAGITTLDEVRKVVRNV